MQRAVLTLPAGAACLLASIFALMAGLTLPWHKRRTTKEERADYTLLASLLRLNMGRGFYRNDDFQEGRAYALSDASKSPEYTGGGYVTRGVRNCYHFFKYGGRAARKSIMVHEGDTALKCGSDMGYLWRGLMVEFGVDNTSFKGSVAKGYSKSWELTVLCKRWFVIQVRHCFLVNWFWLSTEDNVLADHLSRGREDEFLTEVVRTGFWSAAVTEDPYFLRHPEAGSVRTYENFESMAILDSDDVSAWTPQCEGDYGPMVLDPPTPPPGQGYMVGVSTPVRGAASDTPSAEEAIRHMSSEPYDATAADLALEPYYPYGRYTHKLRCKWLSPLVEGMRARATAECAALQAAGLPTSVWHERGGDLGSDVIQHIDSFLVPSESQRAFLHARRLAAIERHDYKYFLEVATPVFGHTYEGEIPATLENKRRPTHLQRMRKIISSRAAVEKLIINMCAHYRWRREFLRRYTLERQIEARARLHAYRRAAAPPPVAAHAAAPASHTPREDEAITHMAPSPRITLPPGATTPRATPPKGRLWLHVLCFATMCGSGLAAPASAVSAQQMSVPYARSMIFDGLPSQWTARLEDIMDMRLTPSSMRTVKSAMKHWRPVAIHYSWPVILKTDDTQRAAKLATFVLTMMEDTTLVYRSISAYVWGLRQYMILHHQADPIYGVANWKEFMASVQVLTHVTGEPRRALPMEVIQSILEDADEASFEDVCFNFFIVLLLFTFSRSECPCPKTFDGFDPEEHWQVCDIRWRCVDGAWCLAVRFKKIKQDPRITRPAAAPGEGDWAYVGDAPEPFSVLKWFRAYMQFFPQGREPGDPFFLARDRTRPYTYSAAMSDLRQRCARINVDGNLYGIHGLRVEGYNASLRANGEKRTVAHGLWSGPSAAGRYLRLSVSNEVVPMANNMVQLHNKRQGVAPSAPFEDYGSDVSGFLSDSESDGEVPEDDPEDDDVEVPERVFNPRRRVSPAPSRQRASSRRAAESAPGSSRRRSSRFSANSRP